MTLARYLLVATVSSLAACQRDAPPAVSIVLDTIVELQTSSGPGEIPEPPASIVHLRDGRYLLITEQLTQWHAPIYGPSGNLVDSLGPRGGGPGEYLSVDGATLARGDSVVVASSLEVRTLSPDLAPVRRVTLQVQPQRLWSDSAGNILVMGFRGAPESHGARVHLHSPEGEFLHSLSSADSGLVDVEMVAVSDGGTGWWTVPMMGVYRIDHWNHDGSLLHGIRIDADWHPQAQPDRTQRMGPDTPPPPRVQGISLASDGRLWIPGTVAAEGWKKALASAGSNDGPEGGGGQVFISPDELLDGVVDLIDPGSGQQVATLGLSELIFPMSGDTLFTVREDSSGFWHVTIVRARIDE